NEILVHLQDEILSLFDADRITVYVVDGRKKQIVSRFKTGNEVNEIRVSIDKKSVSGYCAASGSVVNVSNAYDDRELKNINAHLCFNRNYDIRTGYRTSQILAAPIQYKNYILGVIQLINKKDGVPFTSEDEDSAVEIANVLGIAFFKNQQVHQKRRSTKFDFLISNGLLSAKELEEAVVSARKVRQPIENVLMHDFEISKEDIGRSLAAHFKTRFIPYEQDMVLPLQLRKGLRPGFLRNNLFVPVSQSGNTVVIAMEDPDHLPVRDTIRRLITGHDFEYCVSLREDLSRMIDLFYSDKSTSLLGATGSITDLLGACTPDEEEESEVEKVSEEDGTVVQLVNKMIIDAYNSNASDIHIEPRPGKTSAVIRFRVDGACQVYQTIPYTFKKAVLSRLKIMSDLDISERRLPQDGKIKYKRYGPLDIEIRIATIPTAGGNEDAVLRILPAGKPIPLEAMGMSDRNYSAFVEMIGRPYGIVLVVGPTGSGKTTTLHAALHHINRTDTKIWTAEDPVEITQEGLRQVQVRPQIGFDFSTAMRAFLRADPDVIMVGEMRDRESVATGIEASLTGHLVFSTLHTNSAPETITRLLDMGMDPFNFADALLAVLAQRLVRTLCKECREAYHPDRDVYDLLVRACHGNPGKLEIEYSEELMLHRPKGCTYCGKKGYRGRTGLHELLLGTDEMKSLIQGRAKVEDLRAQAIRDGMSTLMQDGVRKIFLGKTDLLQVRRVCMR
ncbi:MAG: ATPase, T2SS/T4P/T4SS family, partial [Desulfatiglandales bacterium]